MVLLKTTIGDIDVELWSKEAPKACRNFVQLCMEGYYNNTIFHRIVKGEKAPYNLSYKMNWIGLAIQMKYFC